MKHHPKSPLVWSKLLEEVAGFILIGEEGRTLVSVSIFSLLFKAISNIWYTHSWQYLVKALLSRISLQIRRYYGRYSCGNTSPNSSTFSHRSLMTILRQ